MFQTLHEGFYLTPAQLEFEEKNGKLPESPKLTKCFNGNCKDKPQQNKNVTNGVHKLTDNKYNLRNRQIQFSAGH